MEFSCDGIKNNVEQRYEVLLQMAPFGFLLIDLAGNIIEVNKPALDILGSPPRAGPPRAGGWSCGCLRGGPAARSP